MLITIIVLVGLAAYFIVAGALFVQAEKPRFLMELGTARARRTPISPETLREISLVINRPFMHLPLLGKLQDKAEFLRLPYGAIEILLMKEFFAIVGGFVIGIAVSPVFALGGVLVGFMLPDLVMSGKEKKKKEEIVRIFPETVDLLDLCIGSGLDFLSSVRWVVEKARPNAFTEQLTVVMNEIRVGKSRAEALRDMAKRINVAELSSFSRTIVQAERMGVSIEEALRNLSEDTRNLRFERGERSAIKASLKILIPLLFFILPVVLIIVAGPVIIQFTQGQLFGTGGM